MGQLPFAVLYMVWTAREAVQHLFASGLSALGLVFVALGVCFLRAYIACWLLQRVQKQWFKVAVYGCFFTGMFITLFLNYTFKMQISPTIFTLLAETNRSEVTDFFHTFILSSATLTALRNVVVMVVIAVVLEWLHSRYIMQHLGNKWRMALGILQIPLLTVGAYGAQLYADLFTLQQTDELMEWEDRYPYALNDEATRLLQSAWGIHLAAREVPQVVHTTLQVLRQDKVSLTDTDTLNVVLVIGESFIKWHSNLYGYPLNTTPNLTAEHRKGNLFVMNRAETPFNTTSKVMRNMLCCNSLAHGEPWNKSPYFLSLVKKAGYRVLWWDNQRDMLPGESFSFALNSFLYHPDIVRTAYSQTNTASFNYDGQLLDDFEQHAQFMGSKHFMVFHLIGQHMMPESRFPHKAAFMRFRPHDIPARHPWLTPAKRQIVADYDNATYYNDWVIGRLFQRFAHTNTALVYLSDHGEEVYDYRDSFGRVNDELTPQRFRYQYEIPLFIWFSPTYQKLHPQTVEATRRAIHRHFTSDNLCHLLFHLAGIKTSYYRAERDLLFEDAGTSKKQ